MNRKKIISVIALLCLLPTAIRAQGFYEQRILYPIGTDNGKRVVTVFQTFNTSDERILANAMLWAINTTCAQERDQLFDINVNRKTFSFNTTLEELDKGKTKYSFTCKVNIRVSEGKLVCTVYDISYKTGFILASDFPLERLNDEKPKQKEVLNAFQRQTSGMLNLMFDAVAGNRCLPISHWNDIHLQRPVKGMNEAECLLAFGKPQSIYEPDANGVQWSYNLNFVLIFRNGQLATIIR
ncbi:MAG: hypothetical protein IJ710_04010 [Prevotella sp.]|nr:hypothetical protein [Prevotella sp.]